MLPPRRGAGGAKGRYKKQKILFFFKASTRAREEQRLKNKKRKTQKNIYILILPLIFLLKLDYIILNMFYLLR
jgi:hypothetical protein